MHMPVSFPHLKSPSAAALTDKNPPARLFKYMDERFGKNCHRIKAKRYSFICCQGAEISSLYLIHEGEILLTRVSLDGRETLLSILGPGDFFGESALLSGSAVTYNAVASKRSVLSQLPGRKFRQLLEDPLACRYLLDIIAQRCNDAWTQMEVIGCAHVGDKVRSGLLWLSNRIGVATNEGIRLDLNQTRLARMIGCARETLSRELNGLKKRHAIDVRYSNGRKFFYVLNPDELSHPA